MTNQYDDREAFYLLGKHAGCLKETNEDRSKAALELLNAFCESIKEIGFNVSPDPENRTYTIVNKIGKATLVLDHSNGDIHVKNNSDSIPAALLPLVYNHYWGMFEGEEEDTYICRTPGEPIRKRPAFAVLMEYIIKSMKGSESFNR